MSFTRPGESMYLGVHSKQSESLKNNIQLLSWNSSINLKLRDQPTSAGATSAQRTHATFSSFEINSSTQCHISTKFSFREYYHKVEDSLLKISKQNQIVKSVLFIKTSCCLFQATKLIFLVSFPLIFLNASPLLTFKNFVLLIISDYKTFTRKKRGPKQLNS